MRLSSRRQQHAWLFHLPLPWQLPLLVVFVFRGLSVWQDRQRPFWRRRLLLVSWLLRLPLHGPCLPQPFSWQQQLLPPRQPAFWLRLLLLFYQ